MTHRTPVLLAAAMTVLMSVLPDGHECRAGETPDPVFDIPALLAPPLDASVVSSTEQDGIVTEQVRFLSHVDEGERVEIFAFFSYPKGAKGLPAFIWNQGGLYPANDHFTKLGAKRGYAALCIDFPIPGGGYRSTGKYPINSGVELGDDPRKAPIYFGAVALLRAVSFLESREEVDKDRIGMCGSSWGGFYTTLMVGVDGRLKAGSAMFGSGHMQMGNAWWGARAPEIASRDDAFLLRWEKSLDPATRLAQRETPIAWFTASNDHFYWLPAVSATRDRARGPTHLVLLPNWNHGLTPNLDEQVFRWLDIHLKGGQAFLKVSPVQFVVGGGGEEGRGVTQASFTWEGERKPARAFFAVSPGAWGAWSHRIWITVPAQIEGNRAVATLPNLPMAAFVYGTVVDEEENWSSTSVVQIDNVTPDAVIKADGCAEWGGFEPGAIAYLVGQGFMNPTVRVGEGRGGSQAAELKKGSNQVRPIYFVAGLKHKLTLWLRSTGEAPVDVTVELVGRFDNEPRMHSINARVTPEWTKVELEYPVPDKPLVGTLGANITVHGEAAVLLDDVSFIPLP